ncbi:hypothetical protein HCU74_01385 [Spongiibacter sp. KMU-166]|uniref:HTH luxR-type domain-containing protein n=1 Tax=Spongiibacter thalassae TaxID=2721624 RepID=A0ABX1GAT7_9GAMM|nr:LuxR C-terminal-related transcriptional regulator [Spongiibacter thalassae]NKI16061.1 hypothetical protein [Spongiibacter thalassae]
MAAERRNYTTRIAKAKTLPPRRSAINLQRQAISDREGDLSRARLVVIQAPAGFGKTTAMMQLIDADQRSGNLVAWLTLEEADNDVTRFLRGFALALHNANPAAPMDSDHSRNADLADWIIATIEDAQQPTSIYFDNFEAVHNPVVLGLIQRGIQSLPPGSRAIIASRKQAELGLAKLRARGELIEFDASHLRFSSEEAAELINRALGSTLTASQHERLYRSTEGWAAALWLASMALRDKTDAETFIQSFSGSNAAVASYLAEDVLRGLSEELRQFLLRISVLDELTPELCDAVTRRRDSADLLTTLHQQGLFVQLEDEGQSNYSFHALFRDFLRTQLERQCSDADIADLHHRAAEAYLQRKRPIPALHHRFRSRDYTRAIALLQAHLPKLLDDGRLRLTLRLIDTLPGSVLAEHSYLQLVRAWCIAFTRGPNEALAIVSGIQAEKLDSNGRANLLVLQPMLLAMTDRIEESHTIALGVLPKIDGSHHFALSMLYQSLTQTSIILGEHDNARKYVDKIRGGSIKSGLFGAVLAESAEGLLDLMKGQLSQAITRLQHAMDTFASSREGDRRGITLAAIQLAEALYEAGKVDDALKLVDAYSPLVQEIGPADALISASVVHAKIVYEQDRNRAMELLLELEERGRILKLPRVVATARLQRANFWLAEGNDSGAEEQIRIAEQLFEWPDLNQCWYVANDYLTPEICRLRWMLRTGKVNTALPQLRDATREAERSQHNRRALKLRLLLAEAYQEDGQTNLARRTMGKALKMAHSEGFMRCLTEEGNNIAGLINDIQAGHDGGEDAPSLAPAEPAHAVGNVLNDPLTPKEMQVLSLLAEGLSNIAMAEKLFVSESTVRTHLRSINLKLDAKNRTEAVVIARRLKLVN